MTSPVTTKDEAMQRLRTARKTLVSFGVKRIGIFGSFISGHPTESSDVDVLVEFVPKQHCFDNFMELSFFLEDLLGRKVDLVTTEGLSRHIGPHILREVEIVSVPA